MLSEQALKDRLFHGHALREELDAGAARIKTEVEALHRLVREQDRGLDPLFKKTGERFDRELARLREKTLASLAQREDAGDKRLAELQAWVRPFNQPQERVFCTGLMLAQHPTLPEELLPQIEALPRGHRVVLKG